LFLLISGPGPWSLDGSLRSGEEEKRDSLVEATARRPPLTVRRPSEAGEESWSDARRVVRRLSGGHELSGEDQLAPDLRQVAPDVRFLELVEGSPFRYLDAGRLANARFVERMTL